MRSKLVALLVLVVIACASNTTSPAGPVGKPLDLRSRITNPESAARAPADDQATVHEHVFTIQGIETKVVWRTFADGPRTYIVSAGWEIVTPRHGFTLEPMGTLNPTNAGTVEAPVQAEILRIRWHDNTSSCSKRYGEASVRIDASGAAAAI